MPNSVGSMKPTTMANSPPANAGVRGRQGEGEELDPRDRNAERLRRIRAQPDRIELAPDTRRQRCWSRTTPRTPRTRRRPENSVVLRQRGAAEPCGLRHAQAAHAAGQVARTPR